MLSQQQEFHRSTTQHTRSKLNNHKPNGTQATAFKHVREAAHDFSYENTKISHKDENYILKRVRWNPLRKDVREKSLKALAYRGIYNYIRGTSFHPTYHIKY